MTTYNMQPETIALLRSVPPRTVADESARLGVRDCEPLLIAMDSMIRYAKAYRIAQDSPVGEDGVLGPEFGNVIAGLRALLNGDGAVAMERGLTTDSKDNSMIESMYWTACKLAGLDGDNL